MPRLISASFSIGLAVPKWAGRSRRVFVPELSAIGVMDYLLMAVALLFILVAVGSVLFHLFSPWWWTPIASNWSYIDNTISLTFWITGFVFSAVVLFMAYCILRFRHRDGLTSGLRAGEPEAGVVAHHRDRGGRRRHAGSGPVRVAAVRHGPRRGVRVRGRGSAVAVELSPPGKDGRLGAGTLTCQLG